MNRFPKWVYSATEAAKIVHSEEEEAALDDSWQESPACFQDADQSVITPKKRGRPKKAK